MSIFGLTYAFLFNGYGFVGVICQIITLAYIIKGKDGEITEKSLAGYQVAQSFSNFLIHMRRLIVTIVDINFYSYEAQCDCEDDVEFVDALDKIHNPNGFRTKTSHDLPQSRPAVIERRRNRWSTGVNVNFSNLDDCSNRSAICDIGGRRDSACNTSYRDMLEIMRMNDDNTKRKAFSSFYECQFPPIKRKEVNGIAERVEA
ncbi:hypothetical protein ACOME3_001903 [Neoechinorhynchus agilis]